MNCIDKIAFYAKGLTDGKIVLEVGSNDGNMRLRNQIKSELYYGIDINSGNGVDYVCKAEDIAVSIDSESYDVILSSNVLEHVQGWKEAIHGMKTICKRGGYILMTVPSAYPYHGDPKDYWRYSITDMENIFSDFDVIELHEVKQDAGAYVPDVPSETIDAREVFIMAQKPEDFKENDLSLYEIDSIKEGEWTKLEQ